MSKSIHASGTYIGLVININASNAYAESISKRTWDTLKNVSWGVVNTRAAAEAARYLFF